MNKILKAGTFLTAAVMALSVGFTAFAADFTDMPSDPAMKQALENAVNNKLLNGYETGEIKPDGKITRAEMSAIITRCFGASKTADISRFTDVTAEQWYYNAMSQGVAMGAFNGDGNFLHPDDNITFQETFAVISRIFDLQDQNEASISMLTDKDKIDAWAKEYVVKVFTGGYWGEGITELRPQDYITRGEFALLMNRLVQVYVDAEGSFDKLDDVNVVVRKGNVTFKNVKNTKKIIIGDGVEGDVIFTGSDMNMIVGRGGNVVPDNTTVTSMRLIVVGASATVGTTIEREKNKCYYGIPGTSYNFGSINIE